MAGKEASTEDKENAGAGNPGETSQNEDPVAPELLPLEYYNRLAREHHARARLEENKPRLNGLACPLCGAELLDSQPMYTLASSPPQKNVNCSKCNYAGYRVGGPTRNAALLAKLAKH